MSFLLKNINKPKFYSFFLLFSSISPVTVLGGNLEFSGNQYKIIELTPEKSTGLENIFVLHDTSGVSMTYSSDISSEIEWLIYSNLGGGYAEKVPNVKKEGNSYTIDKIEGDHGYIINDGGSTYSFWVTDYSKHIFNAEKLTDSGDSNCGETILDFVGNADPIYYYTINGRQETLSREIRLEYLNLAWDEEEGRFISEIFTKTIASCGTTITINPPIYCNTTFLMEGDRFLQEWGESKMLESNMIMPTAVSVETEAIQEDNSIDNDEMSNQINSESDGLGGSAPCRINFYAYVTDAVMHYEWQMAEDEEFTNVSYRFNEQDLEYTFTEEGTTYVRFIGSNADGSCESIGDTYKVVIGASELLVPNAFSPNDDGVNDIWKVSYRSLLDFKCWIYDRHGHQLYYFEDPSGGWDGKKNGKTVKSGVYYYVIQAIGSDGKKYKKSGDINILNYKGGNTGLPEQGEE